MCRKCFVYVPFHKEEGKVYRNDSAHFKYQLFHSRWRGVGRENNNWGKTADGCWNNVGHNGITSMLNYQGAGKFSTFDRTEHLNDWSK